MGSGTPAVAPVTVDASTINEFAALNGGHFILENSILELAVLASNGAGSILEVNNSVINSQTLVSDGSSFLRVQDSTLFGPLVQATGDARIALLNNTLNHNVCHAQCKPLCLPMGVDSCNPFNPPNADVRFVVPDTSPVPNNPAILVAGVEPIAAPVTAGAMLQFTGDVLVESRNPAFMPYTYSLAYGRDFNSLVPITQNQAGPRRGQVLGALDTTSLNGAYVVVLTLNAGTVSLPVARPFSVQ